MAANDTVVTVVGNLTDDPKLTISKNGTSWVRFAVASTPRIFDRNANTYRDGDTLFLTCTAFRDLAEHIAESLTKGTRVIVTGRLKQSRWETPEGDKRSAYGLDVDEIGPSLRFANATIQKLTRTSTSGSGDGFGAPDPWASTTAPADSGARAPF